MGVESELVDVVNKDDQVIRTTTRAAVRAENLLHRGVFIAVMSTDGRLLVHQRSEHKDVWPGYWDTTVGGVVGAGETYEAAAVRELAEEIGVSGEVGIEPIGNGIYEDAEVRVVGRCFRVIHDGPYRFTDGEIVAARLVTPEELSDLLLRERFVPDSLHIMQPLLGGNWNPK